jgi:MucR family transcriptional regulator, transcriptional regulator of exopolysaccharide biosynthesis
MNVENQRRTTEIVAAYVRKNLVSTDQIAGLINSVHLTLAGLGNEVVEEPPRVPAVSVRRSVHADYIICLECGYKGKMLKRHLQSGHGLSVSEYRSRWKLSSDYPMTAANYSERRSQLAKSIGLGRRPGQSAAMPAVAPETTPEKPARRRAANKAAQTRTSAAKASPRKVSAKADAQKAGARTNAKKASAKKASNGSRSRKPSSRAATKAASAPEAATA